VRELEAREEKSAGAALAHALNTELRKTRSPGRHRRTSLSPVGSKILDGGPRNLDPCKN
jgi:hypothetical protein